MNDFPLLLAYAIIWGIPIAALVALVSLLVTGLYAFGVWRKWWKGGPPTDSAGPQ